ncbi:MAG: transposase [Clostridia bacterium]|nr:transposase [Clostridia bacterium]
MEQNKNRKKIRLKGANYSDCGAYFITVCTKNKEPLLSDILLSEAENEPCVVLKKHGAIADKIIIQLDHFYENLSVDQYIIMPNHIHLLLLVTESESTKKEPSEQNTVISKFVSTFKRFCNKKYGMNIWQSRSFDHIIRNKQDYDEHVRYILNNPSRWFYRND